MPDSIAARLAALPQMPTPELRAVWVELFGTSRTRSIPRPPGSERPLG